MIFSVLPSNMEIDPLAVEVTDDINKDIEIEEQDSDATWVHQDLAQVKIKVFRGHKDAVSSCSFCCNDEKALTSSLDKTVKLWNLDKGVLLNTYEGHDLYVTQARPDHTGNRFASCGWDKKVCVWNTETGRILWKGCHDGIVTCCKFSRDGEMLLTASDLDHTLKVWDCHNGELITEIKDLHSSTVTSCSFVGENDKVVSSSMDKTTCFWDLKSRSNTITLSGHINVVSDLSLTANDHRLATVSWDKSICLWDIATGAYRNKGPEKIEKAHEGCISSCDFTPEGRMLVTGGYDNQVCVWDTENNVQKLRLQGHEGWVEDVCFSADQKWILSVSKDRSMRLWNVEKSDEIPLVLEKRRAIGLKVYNCSACGKQFSISQTDKTSDVKLCVFCRLKTN